VRIYLDAAPVIYLVEQVSPFASEVSSRLSQSSVVLIASDLTKMECLVKPLRDQDTALLEDYRIHFNEATDELVSLTSEVVDRATSIRAHHGFGVADAIHLAAALVSGCDLFLTNDRRLAAFKDIEVEVLSVS